MIRTFAEPVRRTSIGRLENARQFHDFLTGPGSAGRREPPYLPGRRGVRAGLSPGPQRGKRCGRRGGARREHVVPAASAVVPVSSCCAAATMSGRCSKRAACNRRRSERDTPLASPCSRGGRRRPGVRSSLPAVFDLLAGLDDGPRARHSATPEADELIAELAPHGLLEVRP